MAGGITADYRQFAHRQLSYQPRYQHNGQHYNQYSCYCQSDAVGSKYCCSLHLFRRDAPYLVITADCKGRQSLTGIANSGDATLLQRYSISSEVTRLGGRSGTCTRCD